MKNHLLYLINKHRSGDKISFCPDLAPSHYTQTVIYSLEAETIKVVPKTKNLPNFLEARPINKFWVICKQKYAEWSKTSKNLKGFERNCKNFAFKVAKGPGPHLMQHGNTITNKIAKNGVEEIFFSVVCNWNTHNLKTKN